MKIAGKLEDKLVKVSRREYIFPAFDYFYETSFFLKNKVYEMTISNFEN